MIKLTEIIKREKKPDLRTERTDRDRDKVEDELVFLKVGLPFLGIIGMAFSLAYCNPHRALGNPHASTLQEQTRNIAMKVDNYGSPDTFKYKGKTYFVIIY